MLLSEFHKRLNGTEHQLKLPPYRFTDYGLINRRHRICGSFNLYDITLLASTTVAIILNILFTLYAITYTNKMTEIRNSDVEVFKTFAQNTRQ